MRQLSVLLCAGLLIASAAPAVAASDEARASPPVGNKRPVGDPLMRVDPGLWLPTLLETGSLAQAAMVAMFVGDISFNLFPLGDANGDGKEDFLLENETTIDTDTEYSRTAVVRAVSGLDFATLWTLEVPENAYWFVVGDIDANKVQDIVVTSSTSTTDHKSQNVQGASVYRTETNFKDSLRVVSGASGADLFPLSCESRLIVTSARATAAVVSGRLTDYKWTTCGVMNIPGGAGIDVIRQTLADSRNPSLTVSTAYAALRVSTEEIHIARHDAAGAKSWEWDLTRDQFYVYIAERLDYTGDGVPDIAYLAQPEVLGYAYAGPVRTALPNPLKGELGVVDGKSGRLVWTMPVAGSAAFAEVEEADSLRAPGSKDLIVSQLEQADGPHGAWQAVLRQVNGATGSVLSTYTIKDHVALAAGHDDVDGDGREELLLLKAKVFSDPVDGPSIDEATTELTVVKTTYAPVWGPLRLGPNDEWPFFLDPFDLDGDAVNDLRIVSWSDGDDDEERGTYRFLSGATGEVLWSYVASRNVVSVQIVGDIDGTPGDDVAITIFDLPEKKEPPSPPSGAPGTPQPASSRGQRDAPNFADAVGRLELRRGVDRELVWEKRVHDPSEVQNVTAEWVYASAALIPDTNGDGFPDLLFNLQTPEYAFYFSSDMLMAERQEEGLRFAMLISGADGKTLKAYPDAKGRTPAVIGKAARLPPMGPGEQSGTSVPGPSVVLALLAVALFALRRRAYA